MLDYMQSIFTHFADGLMNVLPTSPFAPYINQMTEMPYLSWLNWFVPVGDIITVSATWLAAITLFYIYSIVLRWVRAIQ